MTPVSKTNLAERINRKLSHEDKRLCKSTERERTSSNLGEYHIIDTTKNQVIEMQVDLEELGRKLGALEPHETVED